MEPKDLLIISIVVITLLLIFFIIYLCYARIVKNNSVAIKELKSINEKYTFYRNFNNYDESHSYDNKIFYDSISCNDYLIYILQFNKRDIKQEIFKDNHNRNQYNSYQKEIENINSFNQFELNNKKYIPSILKFVERKLFNKAIIKKPEYFTIEITLSLTKINGSLLKTKYKTFTSEDIDHYIYRLSNKNKDFYNDREIWDSICRVERGKVSNKMRFRIYKRDGYRCCICGRGEKYDYLEIDHIKPIAKGGKSTYNNLQTLCRRCNKQKGDTY